VIKLFYIKLVAIQLKLVTVDCFEVYEFIPDWGYIRSVHVSSQ